MRALFILFLSVFCFRLFSVAQQTPASGSVNIKFQSQEFVEQYIPESKQFSIQKTSDRHDEVLVLVYPFYQSIIWAKAQGEPIPVGYPKNISDGLLRMSIIDVSSASPAILTFAANIGQDLVWHKWINVRDTVYLHQQIQCFIPQPLLRELVINKSLHHAGKNGVIAVETGKVLERKPGMIAYSTTTDMRGGDCFIILIPHQPLTMDSVRAKTILYAREGLETKIYMDDILLNWRKEEIGTGTYYIANVQHRQQFGADLSFEVYLKERHSFPDATLVVVRKNAIPEARRGHDAKGLYQADLWHQYIRKLQAEFKELQLAEQLKRKAELSTILAGRTFRLAIAQDGRLQEISSQPGSVIYQIDDRFFLVMNPSLEYALMDMDNLSAELQFQYSKAEYFPSIQLLALTGKDSRPGAVLHVGNGKLTPGHYKQFVVRNGHLYANTANETKVFSDKGEVRHLSLAEKVLFESPSGKYFLVKNQGRGEVHFMDKSAVTTHQYFFTQFGTVDDQGVILGRANQAMAKILNDQSLTNCMHFYRFRNGQPILVSKAGCLDAQYLGGNQVACKIGESNWQLYTINGSRQSARQYHDLESLLASLQKNPSDIIWNKELRPAALRSASIEIPEKSELIALTTGANDVLGVIVSGEKRVWLLR